ncbi:MAG: M48 family metalloprotease [Desulfovibrionaceae bacterium]|jgi:predicted Zn-dependent protease|nr:M48 family metalloprotease [Desulfovibrionaceae bacterium]
MAAHRAARLGRDGRFSRVGRSFRTALALLLTLAVLLEPALAPPPATAALFGEFTTKDEIELGRKVSTMIKSTMPIIEDPEIKGYVADVVDRLKAVLPAQPFPIESNVILNNTLNAFALPGGYVFVYTGLILAFDSEAELAGVMAHELGHVTQRHVAQRIEKAQLVNIATLVGMVAGVFMGSSDARQALTIGSAALGKAAMLNYSREDEREADNVGMNYLVAAGFPADGLINGLKAIEKNRWVSGGGSMPAYLSTHPLGPERIAYLDQRLQRLTPAERAHTGDDTRFHRAQILLRARHTDAEQALAYFKEHLADSPLCPMGLAIAYARLNKFAEAEHAFSLALEQDHNDSLIHREAGRFYFTAGDFQKASAHLLRASILNPSDLMALFFYARVLDESGNRVNAAGYYRKLLEKLPEDSEIHYYFGRSLGQQGDYFHARLHLFYSALYANDRKKTQFNLEKARAEARTEADKAELKDAEKALSNRAEFW